MEGSGRGCQRYKETVIKNFCTGRLCLEPLIEGSQLSFPGRNCKANRNWLLLGEARILLRRHYA